MKNGVFHGSKVYEVRDRRDLLDPMFHSSADLVQFHRLSCLLVGFFFLDQFYNGALVFPFCAVELLHIQLKTEGHVLHDDAL